MFHISRSILRTSANNAVATAVRPFAFARFPAATFMRFPFSTSNAQQARRHSHGHSTNQQANKQAQAPPMTALESNVKEIGVVTRLNNVSLEIEFDNKERRIFFVDSQFTFDSIREMIEFEFPNVSVELDFTRCGSALIDANSNLISFLGSSTPGELLVEIDGQQQYVLRNAACNPLNAVFASIQPADQAKPESVLHWFLECQKNNIPASHAGVLSHLITNFQHQVKTLKNAQQKDIKLSDTEIDNLMIKSFKSFSAPVTQEIESIQHERNIIEQELQKLYEKRDKLNDAATKNAIRYLKLILLLSVVHISAFYYMIFQVDWLGWDIIEPITYTVSQIAVILGIRFFLKHRQVRSVESIVEIARQRYLQKRVIKDFHGNLSEQIALKEQQLAFLQQRSKLLLNKKTYNTIQLQDI